MRKKNDKIYLILTSCWNSVHEEGSCSCWLTSFLPYHHPRTHRDQPCKWLISHGANHTGTKNWRVSRKGLSLERAFCVGQHITSLSGSKSHPQRWTPWKDHGPRRPHTGAEETSKKEGDTEEKSEEQRVPETPTSSATIDSPKGPTMAMREKDRCWSEVQPGRGGGKVFSFSILCLSSLFLTTQIVFSDKLHSPQWVCFAHNSNWWMISLSLPPLCLYLHCFCSSYFLPVPLRGL